MKRRHRARRYVGIALAAVLAGGCVYWLLVRSGAVPAPPPIPAAAAPTVTLSPFAQAPTDPGRATGCLGGSDPAQAVLAAQQAASIDGKGAAEFALTFLRWGDTYPQDPNMLTVVPKVVLPAFQGEMVQSLSQYAAIMNANGYRTSGTTPGAADEYRILTADPATSGTATVAALLYLQSVHSDGQLVPTRVYNTLVLDVVDGHWQVAAAPKTAPADPLADIPGVPFQPYSGVC